jgi:hypothetical protein
LSPQRSVERPVPPPMATTRSWRGVFIRPLTSLVGQEASRRCSANLAEGVNRGARSWLYLGVEELGEAGIFGYAVEIGVKARLEAVLAIETDGFGEVLDAGVVITGEGGKEG